MGDDRVEVLGRWSVKFKNWVWEYEFSADGPDAAGGPVTWRDTLSPENGKGRWLKSGNLVNMTWTNSTTTESWRCPIVPPDVTGWYNSTYGTGPYHATKIPRAVVSTGIPVNPEIASIPWDRYLDEFAECKYDMNYKVPADKSFAYSSIFVLEYGDGVTIEFDFDKDFKDTTLSSVQARDAMAQGYLGPGGRIFPRVVAPATAPRIWSERADALAMQNEDASLFTGVAVAGVAFVLSVPAMPAGAPPSSPAKVGRRRVPGVVARPLGSRLASTLRQAGKRVVVNIGGTGEVSEAINLNPNKVASRKDIPNLIAQGGEEIGQLFEANTIDEIVSNRLPPDVLDWRRIIPGSYKTLKSGGSITIKFQGVGADASTILEEFAKAGFKQPENWAGGVLKAVK